MTLKNPFDAYPKRMEGIFLFISVAIRPVIVFLSHMSSDNYQLLWVQRNGKYRLPVF